MKNNYSYYNTHNYYSPTVPTFDYVAPLSQGKARSGDVVAVAKSHDYDGDFVFYQLVDNTQRYYNIDVSRGVITLTSRGADAINRGLPLPNIKVTATDGELTSGISEIVFSQPDTGNENRNHAPDTPTFTAVSTTLKQGEARAGDLVARAKANDQDNDIVSYSLTDNALGIYTINANTGEISLTALGADKVNAGENLPAIKVIANDGTANSIVATLNAPETILAAVNHAPDAPEITSVVSHIKQGDAQAGDVIARAQANDKEGDLLTYRLMDNHNNIYTINAQTGEIMLTASGASIVNAGGQLPNIRIAANDGQASSLTSTMVAPQTIVANSNHAPDAPTIEWIESLVPDSIQAGTVIAKANSTDIDEDFLTYHLLDNDGSYRINYFTGEISLTNKGILQLNNGETLPTVRVIASDGKIGSQSSVLSPSVEAPLQPEPEPTPEPEAPTPEAPETTPNTDAPTVQFTSPLTGDGQLTPDELSGKITVGIAISGAQQGDLLRFVLDGKVISQGRIPGDGKLSVKLDGEYFKEGHQLTAVLDTKNGHASDTSHFEAVNYQANTDFIDSRDLSNVDLPYFIKALNSDGSPGYLKSAWQGIGQGGEISYRFATSASDQGPYHRFTVSGFRTYNSVEKQAIKDALALFEEQTNLKFTEKRAWEDSHFKFYLDDLKVNDTYAYNQYQVGLDKQVVNTEVQPMCACSICSQHHSAAENDPNFAGFVAGYAYFGGDVHINSSKYQGSDLSKDTPTIIDESANGSYSWMPGAFGTLVHEIGHSVGLQHTFQSDKRDADYIVQGSAEDKTALSVMSYSNDIKQYNAKYGKEFGATATQFGLFDLAVLHYRFGVNENQHAGDSVYGFKDFQLKDENGNYILGSNIYIWDGAGLDTFDASNEHLNVHVDLTPGSWIYKGSKTDQLVYHADGSTVKNQMFIGFGTQIENLKGGSGSDTLIGNEANNHIEGNAGNDTIRGGNGDDWLEGGTGNDTLYGGQGNDILNGGQGRDTMNGGAGNDTYYVDNVNDRINDSSGIDTVNSSISYQLGNGIENLHLIGHGHINATGNSANNVLYGNDGNNVLSGGAGNDTLYGGAGNDTLIGGLGRDVFAFNTALDGSIDIIKDFSANQDKIQLDKSVFSQLRAGYLNSDYFTVGENAKDANDFIIYDKQKNTLLYDADGVGGNDAVAFARFDAYLSGGLNNTHIEVV